MFYPPSLPPEVIARAFLASNGELGLLPADAAAFLEACRADGVRVRGWALWLADHYWDFELNIPRPVAGRWSGIIPLRDGARANMVEGECDLEGARAALANLDLTTLIDPEWLSFTRVNFTLAGH